MIELDEYWQVVPVNRQFGVISLREDLTWWKRQYLVWIKKTEVRWLYSIVQAWLSTKDGMIFNDAMIHGNFKMSDEVKKKVDLVFQLKEGWSIDTASLKALTRGPLLSADGANVLVRSQGPLGQGLNEALRWLEGHPLIRLLILLGGVLSLVQFFASV